MRSPGTVLGIRTHCWVGLLALGTFGRPIEDAPVAKGYSLNLGERKNLGVAAEFLPLGESRWSSRSPSEGRRWKTFSLEKAWSPCRRAGPIDGEIFCFRMASSLLVFGHLPSQLAVQPEESCMALDWSNPGCGLNGVVATPDLSSGAVGVFLRF